VKRKKRTTRKFVADGDYSSISSYRTKSPTTSRRTFGIFRDMSNFLFIYVTISFRTHNSVLWLTGWGTMDYRVKCGVIFMCS